ncbi:MAG: YhjD/YihY/BrkB family envelope integrity protein [Myxococcota bacterium]|jgi:membrane protein|nr:YhjD/YihY/BrkB family envelope integrity protein [Myxococcota bacterium]
MQPEPKPKIKGIKEGIKTRAEYWRNWRPQEGMGQFRTWLLATVRLFFLVARRRVYQQLKLHAQALTYDTMLALVPLLAVMFALVKGFGLMEQMDGQLEEVILSNLSATPELKVSVSKYIGQFVDNVQSGQLGAVAIPFLLLSVISLLEHIEFAFNEIFGIQRQRRLITRLTTYWAIITLGPVLIGASLTLTAALQTTIAVQWIENIGIINAALIHSLPLVITWFAFAAIYLVVPNTKINFSSALKAAIIAGSGWNIAKYGYAIFAKNAFTLEGIYGPLAAMPLFILWLYLSWILVLFGAQLAFAFQNMKSFRVEDVSLDMNQDYRERAGCRVFAAIAFDFAKGRAPTNPEELAADLDIPRRAVDTLVNELKDGNFIRETNPDRGLVPAIELEQVYLHHLIAHFRHLPPSAPELKKDKVTKYLDEIFADMKNAYGVIASRASFHDLAQSLNETAQAQQDAQDSPPESPIDVQSKDIH